jgi:hypothetical protein
MINLMNTNLSNSYAGRAAYFMFTYAQELTGGDLVWIKKPYQSHWILPLSMVAKIKASILAVKLLQLMYISTSLSNP